MGKFLGIPGTDKIPGMGGKGGIPNPADIPKLVQKEVGKALPDQLKNLPEEAVRELVGRVLVPLLAEIFKPAEKVVFEKAAGAVRQMVRIMDGIVGKPYQVPEPYIQQARRYRQLNAGKDNQESVRVWERVLRAYGDQSVGQARPMTAAEAKENIAVWSGWYPVWQQLAYVESKQQVIDDFNAQAIYVDVKSPVTVGFYFLRIYDRGHALADALDRWAKSGIPAKRGAIRRFILEAGPDKIDVTASAAFQLGIIAGVSVGSWGIPTSLLMHFFDELLKALGIPE